MGIFNMARQAAQRVQTFVDQELTGRPEPETPQPHYHTTVSFGALDQGNVAEKLALLMTDRYPGSGDDGEGDATDYHELYRPEIVKDQAAAVAKILTAAFNPDMTSDALNDNKRHIDPTAEHTRVIEDKAGERLHVQLSRAHSENPFMRQVDFFLKDMEHSAFSGWAPTVSNPDILEKKCATPAEYDRAYFVISQLARGNVLKYDFENSQDHGPVKNTLRFTKEFMEKLASRENTQLFEMDKKR